MPFLVAIALIVCSFTDAAILSYSLKVGAIFRWAPFSMIIDIISSSLGRATNMLTSLEEVSTTTRFILVDRIMIYLSVALLYYDWILTLDAEIEYLWLKPKSIISWLILLTRYFPFSSVSPREHFLLWSTDSGVSISLQWPLCGYPPMRRYGSACLEMNPC